MKASGKISVELRAGDLRRVRSLVAAGEFDSADAVICEAVRAWLRSRSEDASRHSAFSRPISRSFARPSREPRPDPFERVELMFDAGDAKA